jgi:hypothetical protein
MLLLFPSPISLTTPPPLPLAPPPCRFNIYILDYCKKRGYHKTATQLVTEADIPPESKPPINAQQGLLFESVSSLLSLALRSPLIRSSQVVECLLGSLSSEKQWRWFGRRNPLHQGPLVSPSRLIYIHLLLHNSIKPRANSKPNELVKSPLPLVLSPPRVILSQMVCPAPPHHCLAAR